MNAPWLRLSRWSVVLVLGAVAMVLTRSVVVVLIVVAAAVWLLRPGRPFRPPSEPSTSYPQLGRAQRRTTEHPNTQRRDPTGAPTNLPTPYRRSRRDENGDRGNRPGREAQGSTEVVCKQVTPERQEWVSSKTGRLYDVLSYHGPPNARPGDRGYVQMTASGWRIVATGQAQLQERAAEKIP